MKRLAIASLLLLGSGHLAAETARTFASLDYNKIDDFDTTTVNFIHFFADQSYNGVYDDFGYLNTDSSITGMISNSDFVDTYAIGGEAFIGNFILGGAIARADTDFAEADSTAIKVGYLFGDNLIVSASHVDADNVDGETEFSVEYNHDLGGNDYFAATITTDDEFDVFTVSPTYFKKLGHSNFIRLGVDYINTPDDDFFSANADYYLSPQTSIGGSVGEDDYSLRAKHYFTFNTALELGYQNFDDMDEDGYYLSLKGQF